MKEKIKHLKSIYPNLRYSNLINGRKNKQWWFTVPPEKFLNHILNLALVDGLLGRIYILRIDTNSQLLDIQPRGAVHRSGEYDLYFNIIAGDINIRYLSTYGYVDYPCVDSIIEIINNQDVINSTNHGSNSKSKYEEGKDLYIRHKTRERNPQLIKDAKANFRTKNGGRLFCEICGFDFLSVYGIEYIEIHHLNALHLNDDETITTLDDVCLVCPNCHRIIHSQKPYLTIEQVKEFINNCKTEVCE